MDYAAFPSGKRLCSGTKPPLDEHPHSTNFDAKSGSLVAVLKSWLAVRSSVYRDEAFRGIISVYWSKFID